MEEKDRVEELLYLNAGWLSWESKGMRKSRGNGNGEMFSILALAILGRQPSPLA